GTLLWTQPMPDYSRCLWLGVGADDAIWVQTASYGPGTWSLFKLASDGSGLMKIALSSSFAAQSNPVLEADGSVYVAGATTTLDSSYVVGLTAAGTIAWNYVGKKDNIVLSGIGVDADGNVYAAGYLLTGDQTLAAVSLTAKGTLRWSQKYQLPGLNGS